MAFFHHLYRFWKIFPQFLMKVPENNWNERNSPRKALEQCKKTRPKLVWKQKFGQQLSNLDPPIPSFSNL